MSVGLRSILCAVFFLCVILAARAADSFVSCLPKDVVPQNLVSDSDGGQKRATVEVVLNRLGARCQDGKLVDQTSKEIRFVHLIGCWGNPPHDYQEQLDAQA